MFNIKRSPESCNKPNQFGQIGQIYNSAGSIMHFSDLIFFQNLDRIT